MNFTWIALLLYIFASIVLGRFAGKGEKNADDFWTAGRGLGSFSVGLSISAGFMSISWSCVYAVQLFYWYGSGALWLVTIPWIIALTGIRFLSKKYHNLNEFSQPEMVEKRFGKGVKRVVAVALASVFLVWGAAEIYVASSLLAPDLGISVDLLILIISIVIAVYTTSGGFKAVILTDKLQYLLVAAYIIIIGFVALSALKTEGINLFQGEILKGAKSGREWTDLFAPGVSLIVLTLFAYLPGWIFETDLWLRIQAAKDDKAAKGGVLIAGINSVLFVGILPMFIGIAALYLFPVKNGLFPAAIGNEGDAIFSAIMKGYAPAWLRFFSSLGLVAAAMSTIDTCINVVALSIGYDMLEVRKRNNPELMSKIVTIAAVSLTFIFALSINSLWDIFYLSSGILTTTVAFPVAAVFLKKVKRSPLFMSSIFGFAGTVLFYFLEKSNVFTSFEPGFLKNSQVGFILYGVASAIIGYGAGNFISALRTDSRSG